MESLSERVLEAVNYIRTKVTERPTVGIILGSGLGNLAYSIIDPIEIPYSEIPYFKDSTVQGHEGKLIFGKIYDKYVVAMKGRLHYYEGYSMQEITFPLRVLVLLGISNLIVTNAAGAVNDKYKVGDLMIIKDHINLSGNSPLMGPNDEMFGPRFPGMTGVYAENLISTLKSVAAKYKINLQEGVYAYMTGPQYETPAEVKMLSVLGADAVGMSTVPEVIVASHSGLNVLGISCITDTAGDSNISHEDILEVVDNASEQLSELVVEFINAI